MPSYGARKGGVYTGEAVRLSPPIFFPTTSFAEHLAYSICQGTF
jgi:hypothetical protein